MGGFICVKCEVGFKTERNGVIVAELFQNDSAIYRLWMADLFKCPKCGHEAILRFADKPFALRFSDDCQKIVSEKELAGETIFYWREKILEV